MRVRMDRPPLQNLKTGYVRPRKKLLQRGATGEARRAPRPLAVERKWRAPVGSARGASTVSFGQGRVFFPGDFPVRGTKRTRGSAMRDSVSRAACIMGALALTGALAFVA